MFCLDYSIKLHIPDLCLNLLTKISSNWRISSIWRLVYYLAHSLYPPIFQILFLLLFFPSALTQKPYIRCLWPYRSQPISTHPPVTHVFSHQTSSPHYVPCTVPGINNTGKSWTLILMRRSSLFKKKDQHINPI